MPQSEETLRQVLEYARQHGQRPTRSRIRRFQQNGLIPKPRQVGLGRAKGTEVRYSAGTGQQLVAACKAIRSKSFRRARWVLWWNGWAIDPKRIRTDLLRQIKSTGEQTKLSRQVRRRLKRLEQSERLRNIMSQLIAGNLKEPLSDPDEKLAAQGIGLDQSILREMKKSDFWPVSGFGNLLQIVAPNYAPAVQKQALRNATDDELLAARGEVRAFVGSADGFRSFFETFGLSVFRRVAIGLAKLTLAEQQAAVIAWIPARQLPTVRAVYELIIELCAQASLISKEPK